MSSGEGSEKASLCGGGSVNLNISNNKGSVVVVINCGACHIGATHIGYTPPPPDCPLVKFEVEAPHNEGEVIVLANVGVVNICGPRVPASMNNVVYVVGAPLHEKA